MSFGTPHGSPQSHHKPFVKDGSAPSNAVPWIREPSFGHTLGERARHTAAMSSALPAIGPPDLVHWARHYGEKGASTSHNPFAPPGLSHQAKDADGYVGFFHHVNGIDYTDGAGAVAAYMAATIGLEANGNGYIWRPSVDVQALGVYHNKPMVYTLCAYNAFARAEFRARLVVTVPRSRKLLVQVDALYTIALTRRLREYTAATVASVDVLFWRELAALLLVRLIVGADDAGRRPGGTVSLRGLVETPQALAAAVSLLTELVPRGYLCGTAPQYGADNACGVDSVPPLRHRNILVDTLIRLVALDGSGCMAQTAFRMAKDSDPSLDYVACRILIADPSQNNDVRFLEIVRAHADRSLCQAALLLVEQARFLLAREACDLATEAASAAVALLPSDYDAWHTLALCHVRGGRYDAALSAINSFPVSFAKPRGPLPWSVDGIEDCFAANYVSRVQEGQGLDLRTFEAFFPPPRTNGKDIASMATLWYDQFQHRKHARHPECGALLQLLLLLAPQMELLAVDSRLSRLAAPGAQRLTLAAHSAGDPRLCLLDFDMRSTWGRTYDLLTLLVALVGWDALVGIKNSTFRAPKGDCDSNPDFIVEDQSVADSIRPWFQLLFLVVYEDLRIMVQMSGQDQHRSALSWEIIGFVGLACKFNLKDSLSALHTSISAPSASVGFDYYGTVKMLEIYNEFVLSDVCAATIDPLASAYNRRLYSNKLIVQTSSPEIHREFLRQLQSGIFSLDNVLLSLSKLVSWNIRWYTFMPSALVTEILIKLCALHDPIVIRSRLQILFRLRTKQIVKPQATYTLRGMFAAPQIDSEMSHEFVEGDTIMIYMAQLLTWIESLAET